jgi:hypothetical protein
MDPLSEVLGSVRLSGGVFLSGRFTAPWCVAIRITADDCLGFLGSKPEQIIGYHVVTQGRMLVAVDGEPTLDVSAGEIILFPQNDPHTLADRAGLKPIPARLLAQHPLDGDVFRIAHGGGGAETCIMCGFLASGDTHNPLFHTLPQVLKVDIRDAASREWIEASVRSPLTN